MVHSSFKQKNSYAHSLLLLLTATIWGAAFVAQSVGMDHVGPMTFVGARSVVAVVALTPVVWFLRRRQNHSAIAARVRPQPSRYTVWQGGAVCGFFMFLGMATQQIGIVSTSIGKAGFITTFYVVLVPLLGVLLGRRIGVRLWAAVVLALCGLYFLCMRPGAWSLQSGDAWVLLSALCFSVQITAVDHYVEKMDGVLLSYLQMAVCAFFSSVTAFIIETPSWSALAAAAVPIVYAGACSSALGYTFQIIGQKGVSPTVASLIMSLESAISALAGWLLLHEVMSSREIFGCVLMFSAIILSQLPEGRWGQWMLWWKRRNS